MNSNFLRSRKALIKQGWEVDQETENRVLLLKNTYYILLEDHGWTLYEKDPYDGLLVHMKTEMYGRRFSQQIKRLIESRDNWRQRNA